MDTRPDRSPTVTRDARPVGDPTDFSLVLGGPLYQLLRRAHLSDDALALQRRRIIVIALLAWLPLLVAAELVVHQRMRTLGRTFRDRGLLPEGAAGRFESAIASAARLRNSLTGELLLIAIVYLVGVTVIWRHYIALDTTTWYAVPEAGGSRLTLAGAWYGYVSLPVFQFLLCRWYFRIVIWARLLWQVSRIELALVPTHPDRVGGLGFLSNTVYAFVPLLVAHGALLAGGLASRIFYEGARLTDFRLEILLMVIFVVCIVVGPLLVFAPQLSRAKRKGLLEYGTLAGGYVRAFDAKWLRGRHGDEPLLGSADIQSLADLGNSLEVVRGMRIVPVSRDAILQLGIVTLAPIVPLVLTMMPLEELLKKLVGIVF